MRPALAPSFTSLLLVATATTAHAQAPIPPATAASTEVSGVTVVARRATPVAGVTVTADICPEPAPTRYGADPTPAVIDTYPKPGGVIAPGALVLRASFSAPMSCYWQVTSESDGGDDPCQDSGDWALPGRTSWTMNCKLKPSTHYTIQFGQTDGHGFVGRSGKAAPAYVLSFETSDAAPTTMQDARRLSSDGLTSGPVSAFVRCSAHPANDDADCIRVSAAQAQQNEH